MRRPLAEGLYEELVTHALGGAIERAAPADVDVAPLDGAEAHQVFARHVAREVERAVLALPAASRAERGARLVDELLGHLATLAPDREGALEQRVAEPARQLREVYRASRRPRPVTPLASSTLLTRNRSEPALGHELSREIASADAIDVLVAFITMGGVRAVRDALERFALRAPARLRVLTTTFSGTTEVRAVDALAHLPGAEVRVSYDTRRTRLHAKAWLFKRESALHTAYVGSANLTSTALGSGQEWMVKISSADLPHVIDKFEGTFESLWNDPEFEPYDPESDAHRARLEAALGSERRGGATDERLLFWLRPLPFQEEILDRLDAERAVHGRYRNLVVAATGTGKTVVAAFDYARAAERAGVRPRLLFLAHRRELLDQARTTFRHALRDGAFGEILGDGESPERFDHVFATIQTAARSLLERVSPDHYRWVVVDECHHVPAESYRRLVPRLRPDVLVGLTATPERSDGQSLLPDFDGHVAAELRLWHALERQLLVPFEYYGIADSTADLRSVRWTRGGYHAGDLDGVYTGNHARVDLVVEQLRRRVRDLGAVRAIAFCVSVEHAEFMAAELTRRGVPAAAVHGRTPDEARRGAPGRLERHELSVLCTCDLYNEGVDLPFVDVLLLLRPTSSATLFLQQIGRGLRVHPGKSSCLVLDFIGQHRAEFRFDGLYSALTGRPRARLAADVEAGFPYLPSGCVLELDAVAQRRILASIRQAVANAKRMAEELSELTAEAERALSLGEYLAASGREPGDVYGAGGWTTLRRLAGVVPANEVSEEAKEQSRRLGWLLHVDEASRIRAWRDALANGGAEPISRLDRLRLAMLEHQLTHRGVLRAAEDTVRHWTSSPAIRAEMAELFEVLLERVALADEVRPIPEWPLALHRRYSRREIVAAVGFAKAGEKARAPQAGILMLEDARRELLFVTLDKSAKSFSPTTRYRDYAVSPTRFHWETQASASVARPSGRRYLESADNGWSFFLFVREDPNATYAFLGPVRYVSHTGDRPIGVLWALEHAMPGGLFDRFATLAGG